MSVTGCWGARKSAFSGPKTWENRSAKRSSGAVLVAPRLLVSCIFVAPHNPEEEFTQVGPGPPARLPHDRANARHQRLRPLPGGVRGDLPRPGRPTSTPAWRTRATAHRSAPFA